MLNSVCGTPRGNIIPRKIHFGAVFQYVGDAIHVDIEFPRWHTIGINHRFAVCFTQILIRDLLARSDRLLVLIPYNLKVNLHLGLEVWSYAVGHLLSPRFGEISARRLIRQDSASSAVILPQNTIINLKESREEFLKNSKWAEFVTPRYSLRGSLHLFRYDDVITYLELMGVLKKVISVLMLWEDMDRLLLAKELHFQLF
jgi:hypothetical protein